VHAGKVRAGARQRRHAVPDVGLATNGSHASNTVLERL
jgi:hypothetical protein